MSMIIIESLLLFCLGLVSGGVNSIAGGGGLLQLPGLLFIASLAGSQAGGAVALQSYFGANKIASFAGAIMAMREYGQRVALPKGMIIGACCASFIGGVIGTYTLLLTPNDILKPIVLVLMALALGVVLYQRSFGHAHMPRLRGWLEIFTGVCLGGALGFYDGFFGPGTGSFLIICFVLFFGYELLIATACAKAVNLMSNGASVLMFGISGAVSLQIILISAVPLGFGNIVGAMIGSRLALRGGNVFIRRILSGMITLAFILLAWRWYGMG